MKKTVWTESLLYKQKILADDVSVKSMIQNFTDKDAGNSLKVNSPYSLTKSIGGIPIEIGELVVLHTELEYVLSLLSDFVSIKKDGKYEILQNIDAVENWTIANHLPPPNKELCDGYVFNNELVNFYSEENIMTLALKYKDSPHTSYNLFKMGFFRSRDFYFIMQARYY